MSVTRQYRQYCTDIETWCTWQTVDDELDDEVEPCPSCAGTDTQEGSITLLAVDADAEVYSTEKERLVVAWASNTTVDVDAVKLGIQGTLAAPFDVTIDIAESGANGLDVDSAANSNWYFVWAIAMSSDGTTAGMLSLSGTAPTMPGDYDRKRLVGVVYRNAAGAFYRFRVIGDWIWFKENVNAAPFRVVNGKAALTSWTTETAFAPSGCNMVIGGLLQWRAGSGVVGIKCRATGDPSTVNRYMVWMNAILHARASNYVELNDSQQFDWAVNNANGTFYFDQYAIHFKVE